MAVFGFVYIWYLMVVLLLEIWFEYRKDFVIWSQEKKVFLKLFYKNTFFRCDNISENALKLDDKIGKFITIIGIHLLFYCMVM